LLQADGVAGGDSPLALKSPPQAARVKHITAPQPAVTVLRGGIRVRFYLTGDQGELGGTDGISTGICWRCQQIPGMMCAVAMQSASAGVL
ncbi:MAG: hypothetical protein ACKPHU_08835, partial [Planctomycetaceae bacterium]